MCAIARSDRPTDQPFIQTLMDQGYVYLTPTMSYSVLGRSYYMIGVSEATDVVNSVRAARNFPR